MLTGNVNHQIANILYFNVLSSHACCCVGVVFCGYAVEGSLAKQVIRDNGMPQAITSLTGESIIVKCKIVNISFAAHADYDETRTFIHTLRPERIVLVHGDVHQQENMKKKLEVNVCYYYVSLSTMLVPCASYLFNNVIPPLGLFIYLAFI